MDIHQIEIDILDELSKEGQAAKSIHTHISVVIVLDKIVLKIKKPVNYGFLDFTTLAKRHYFCLQELYLNKRLAKDIYLNLLPLRKKDNKATLKGGRGPIIEYAVVMKRIEDSCLLKNLLIDGKITTDILMAIGKTIAKYHKNAKTNKNILPFGLPEQFKINTDENFEQIQKYIGSTIDKNVFDLLKSWTLRFYERYHELFYNRVAMAKIRDCHGDLHMEHIAIDNKNILIFDCIEFNDRFRYSDVLNDIAFLIMDMEYNNAKKEAQVILEAYLEEAPEEAVDELLTFYKVYRAIVRGKVTSFQLDHPNEDREAVRRKAEKYFLLAMEHALQISL